MHLPSPTLPPPERPQDTAANFKRYYYLILGRLWLILLIIAVGVGGTWAWLQRQPFIYASTATILVGYENGVLKEQAERRVIKTESVENEKLESPEFVLTAAHMLKSKELMLRVVKRLSLNKDFDFWPLEGCGILVVSLDKSIHGSNELFDAAKAGAAQCLLRKDTEPNLDLIEP